MVEGDRAELAPARNAFSWQEMPRESLILGLCSSPSWHSAPNL